MFTNVIALRNAFETKGFVNDIRAREGQDGGGIDSLQNEMYE